MDTENNETLAEMKARLAAEDSKPEELAEEVVEETIEDTEIEAKDTDSNVEETDEKDKQTETEDWMKSEDEPEKKSFADPKAAAIRYKERSKWEGKVNQANEERERLRLENEELKRKLETAPVISNIKEPKQEDFDTDAEYQKALIGHQFRLERENYDRQNSEIEARRRKEAQDREIQSATEAHYERAAVLSEKSGIKPETYKAADFNFRETIRQQIKEGVNAPDDIVTQAADRIADILIANLGIGSEKVIYSIGINSTKQAKIRELLKKDPQGLSLSAYLGEQKALLSVPVKRETKAVPPMDEIQGDRKGGASQAGKLKKEFDVAVEKDPQKAFEMKRTAKAKGVDVSRW